MTDKPECAGTGRPWETGGKCPECRRTANGMTNLFQVQTRQAGVLVARVPSHPDPTVDITKASIRSSTTVNDTRSDPLPSTHNLPGETSPEAGKTPAKPRRGKAKAVHDVPLPGDKDTTKKADGTPGPTKEARARQTADPVTKPFTENINAYLVWLEKQIGPFQDIDPTRLAGLAITMYGKYQTSSERVASRRAKLCTHQSQAQNISGQCHDAGLQKTLRLEKSFVQKHRLQNFHKNQKMHLHGR